MIHKELDEIVDSIVDSIVSSNIGIVKDDFVPGSTILTLVEAIAEEMYSIYETGDDIETDASASTATGTYLDLIGVVARCPRFESESDESYRLRISSTDITKRTCGLDTICEAIEQIEGVDDYNVERYTYGSGSFSVYIEPSFGANEDVIKANVEEAVDNVNAEGVFFDVKLPVPVNIELNISVNSYTTISEDTIISTLKTFIGSILSGDSFTKNDVISCVQGISQDIVSVYVKGIKVDGKTIYGDTVTLLSNERFKDITVNIV